MQMRREDRRGFTLIEVLLVIVILGMLATVAAVTLMGSRDEAKINTTELTIQKLKNGALERYNNSVGHYPTEEEGGLQALVEMPAFESDQQREQWSTGAPYANDEDLVDAWNNPLQYELAEVEVGTKTVQEPRITSMGPDGMESTEDDITLDDEDDDRM
ncbi:MAG: type II secretion system major pseudopilin GspG [Planctomycetota bacterium]